MISQIILYMSYNVLANTFGLVEICGVVETLNRPHKMWPDEARACQAEFMTDLPFAIDRELRS